MARPAPRALVLLALLALLAPVAGADAPALPTRERERIEALIAAVGSLRDARFVRNGKAYSASDAARFLRKKWESREGDVHSARDFIEKVATLSSTTGQPYRIRYADGREEPSAEFLRARLSELPDPGGR